MGTSLRYPAVALCHGDPVVWDLQDLPLHALPQFIHGIDIGIGPGSVREVSELASQLDLLLKCSQSWLTSNPYYQGQLYPNAQRRYSAHSQYCSR